MPSSVVLHLGVKTDPIEYRYSFRWLFELLAEEQVHRVQLGTFFELYQLPDGFFKKLRELGEKYGIVIESLFTAHRELGGFFIEDEAWQTVAYRNYERLIEIGNILGCKRVGSNPGAILRDYLSYKDKGVENYLESMKKLMKYARNKNLEYLTIEPMSCTAEPPSLPNEIEHFARVLLEYHQQNQHTTVPVGYCFDISHGVLDSTGKILYSHMDLLSVALPYVVELHLKNTDGQYQSTFGFTEEERKKGIIDIFEIVQAIKNNSLVLPVLELTGYLEIPGPKLGRDHTDKELGKNLRESLRYLKTVFC